MAYDIKDINLAPEGEKKIKWVQRHMPVLESIKKEFEKTKPFKGITIGSCLHLEPKTINLGLTLQAGGAEVVMTGCNPLSTQDDATAAGAKLGLNMYGWTGQTNEEYYEHLNKVLDYYPELEKAQDEQKRCEAALETAEEEARTKLASFLRMDVGDLSLKIPVMAVNDSYMKYLFDNRYGTGQSTFDSIMGTTNSVIAGQCVVVCGYGWCGRGIAMRADGLGANVIVTEVDPIRALEARMDGYRVMTIKQALQEADIVVTATGNRDIISGDDFEYIKDGCMLANAGHFNVEINEEDLLKITESKETIKPDIECYTLKDGRNVYLLAGGRLVNLAGEHGQGHPAEIMDLSFAMQALSAKRILEEDMAPGVYKTRDEVDTEVARLKLEAMNIEIDELTTEQKDYMNSWDIGT